MKDFATAGSQRWLQVAVNRKPQLLLSALQRSGAIGQRVSVTWHSPLDKDDFREYRDGKALEKAGITTAILRSLWKSSGLRAVPCGMRWGLAQKGTQFL